MNDSSPSSSSSSSSSSPMTRAQITDAYFMEHRAKLIDIAAFLDRLDRARDARAGAVGGGGSHGDEDFRLAAFRSAIELVGDGQPQRAKRVLELFSDPTTEPIAAAPMKGATGAYSGGGRK